MDSLYFEEGFSIRLNNDSAPLFLLVDYSTRTYPMNMANQHYHDFYEIFITLEDDAAHLVNGRYLQLHKGDIVFLRPQMLHMSIYPKRSAAQRRIIINYNQSESFPGMEYQSGKIKALFEQEIPILRLPPKYLALVVNKLNDLFIAGKEKESGWQLEVLSRFILFLLEIVRNSRHNIYKEEQHPGLPDLKIYAITEYIDTHYMETLSLREIAERFAMSPFYLSHQFTKLVGMSFVNYVQKVRIRYALQMLSYTGARIHDIIADCGFASSSQFNRTFTAFCHMSPSDFRRLSSNDRDIVISSLDPERSEVVPAAFPPRFKTVPRKRRGFDGIKLGVLAEALAASSAEELGQRTVLLGVETLALDIPRCFSSVKSYAELSDKKLSELAAANLDISIIFVKPDERECLAAIRAAAILKVPFVAVLPSSDSLSSFCSLISTLDASAAESGVSLAVIPAVGSAVDGLDGAAELVKVNSDILFILDPLLLLHDERENTFSFFEEVFSLLGDRVVSLLLRDSVDGHEVNLGKGIMAKTYPRIAALISHSMPLIRASNEPLSIADDILYMRRIFL